MKKKFKDYRNNRNRATKDVDAWWTRESTEEEQQEVVAVLENTLARSGKVEIRRFGDVVSLDLYLEGKVCFNFQIALVASKMAALVERGIPRDFLDVYEICRQRICTIKRCWELWKEREKKRGVENFAVDLAVKAMRMHLSRIEKMRPLGSIKEPDAIKRAEALREWFKDEFHP